MLRDRCIDIIYANTRVRISNIPKRFEDCVKVESRSAPVVDRKAVQIIIDKAHVKNAGGDPSRVSASDLVPISAEANGGSFLSRDECEATAMSHVVDFLQESIFLHFQFRSCAKLFASVTFLLLPILLQGTDAAFFPGFPRDSISEATANPKLSSAYFLTYILFFCQDLSEWVMVGQFYFLSKQIALPLLLHHTCSHLHGVEFSF